MPRILICLGSSQKIIATDSQIEWGVICESVATVALCYLLRFTLILLLGGYADITQAVGYDYHDVTADTLPTRYCYPLIKAQDIASDRYNLDRFNKLFCNRLGIGWHVDKRKADGSVVCTPCSGDELGEHQCFMQKMVVSCKRIKPRSAATLPGKK